MKALILCLLLIPGLAYAQQDSSGVYLSSLHFQHHKLTYASDCQTQKHTIKFARFSIKNHIKVIHNDSTYRLLKNEVFGYRDCKGNSFRFIGCKSYTILNPSGYILLYRFGVPNHHEEIAEYRFSRGADGPIMELSKYPSRKVHIFWMQC